MQAARQLYIWERRPWGVQCNYFMCGLFIPPVFSWLWLSISVECNVQMRQNRLQQCADSSRFPLQRRQPWIALITFNIYLFKKFEITLKNCLYGSVGATAPMWRSEGNCGVGSCLPPWEKKMAQAFGTMTNSLTNTHIHTDIHIFTVLWVQARVSHQFFVSLTDTS